MIYVTHDQVEAMTMADKIVVLRAGKIEQVGSPPDLGNRPANKFVAGFIGSPQMNFMPVHAGHGDNIVTDYNATIIKPPRHDRHRHRADARVRPSTFRGRPTARWPRR